MLMDRHPSLYRVLGLALVSGMLFTGSGAAQETTGRATLSPGRVSRDRLQQQLPQQTQAVERPVETAVTLQLPGELETLLVTWEQKSAGIQRLRGTFMRYVYDDVFFVEKRAYGRFWYESPDKGRMDFRAAELPDPPINEERLDPNGAPFRVQAEENQRWICTGEEIYILHDDSNLYDHIEIPPHQQGRNISQGPLPFLFGMRAEDAKQRYHLNLGDQHWPEGRVVQREGEPPVQLRPQVHVVAYPKTEQDRREWRRAEVLLDGESYLPRAIRLLSPSMEKETVYVFNLSQMKVNERVWFPSPFNERPPRDYAKGQDIRAEGDQMPQPQLDRDIVPTAGREAQP